MRVGQDKANFPSEEPHFPFKGGIWKYFQGFFGSNRMNVNELRQEVDRISAQYRETVIESHADFLAFADEVIKQINQVSDLSERICRLVAGVDIPEEEKQSFLIRIKEVRKGLIEIEKKIEQNLKREASEETTLPESLAFLNIARAESFVYRFLSISQKSFTRAEIEELDRLIAQLKESPKDRRVEQILKELESGRKAIDEALERRALLLKRFDLPALAGKIQPLLAKIQRKPRSDLNEWDLLTFNKIADLYWGFNSPFGIQISLKDYLEIRQEKPLMRNLQPGMAELISLNTYTRLSPNELKEVQRGAFQRLKRMRKESLGGPKVVIVGGGPGGLARGLLAASSGADWVLLEKRDRSIERKNVVKIEDGEAIELLLYFGAFESLLISESALVKEEQLADDSISLPIGCLEEALAASLAQLTDEGGRIERGEAVDLRTGEAEPGRLATEVIIKDKEPKRADIIVFADGARSAMGKITLHEREPFSPQTMMFGINLKNCVKISRSRTPYVPPDGGIQFDFLVISGKLGKSGYATVVVREDSANVIRSGQKAVKAIVDAEERKIAEKALEQWFQDCAVHYMNWLGFKGGEAVLARPFNVVISKATEAAVTQGNALILSSGDAYATPDPAASLGCAMAIKSTKQFFACLHSWREGKAHALIRDEQNLAMETIYEPFIAASLSERGRYAGKDTGTALAVLRNAEHKGLLSKEMVSGLVLAFEKHSVGAAYTREDIAWLQEAARLTKREPFVMPANLPDSERRRLRSEYEAYQKDSWKDWLYEKIQSITF